MMTQMIKNSIMLLMVAILVGCVKANHEDTELGAMDKFWSILGTGDTSVLKEKKNEEK